MKKYYGILLLGLAFSVTSTAQEKCVDVKKQSRVIVYKSKPAQKEKVAPGDVFTYLKAVKKGRFFLVRRDRQKFWAKAAVFSKPYPCERGAGEGTGMISELDELEDSRRPRRKRKRRRRSAKSLRGDAQRTWHFGVEVGAGSVSASNIQNALTDLPPNNVDVNEDTYPSPFVERVDSGIGFHLGGFVEKSFGGGLRAKLLVGYQSRQATHVNRPNPAVAIPSVITFPELATETVDVTFNSLYFSLFPSYGFDLWKVHWKVGLVLRGQYFLNQHSIEFRTGPQKLVSYTNRIGYDDFEVEVAPRLEVHLYGGFYAFGELNNRVMPSFDLLLEPSGGIGFQY